MKHIEIITAIYASCMIIAVIESEKIPIEGYPGCVLTGDCPDEPSTTADPTGGLAGDIPDLPTGGQPPIDPPFTGTCRRELEITILMDHSGSIRYAKAWADIQAFANKIIDHVTVDRDGGARFSLITFDDFARLEFGLDKYRDSKAIQAAINKIDRPGERFNTSMRAGLNLIGEAFSKGRNGENTRYIVILISDGLPKDATATEIINLGTRIKEGALTNGKEVDIMTVGVTRGVIGEDLFFMEDLLTNLASKEAWFHSVKNFDRLGSLLTDIIAGTCPYPVPNPDLPECKSATDLTFILDGSGSIKESNPNDGSYDNWNLMKKFVRLIVQKLRIGPDDTQVAIIVYANRARVWTHLNEDNDMDSLMDVIRQLDHKDGNTNTSGAIRTMTRDVYQPARGDRFGVPNVAVVITDGKSTYDTHDTVPAAEEARNLGTRMMAVGITNEVDPDELQQISSYPQQIGTNYWYTPTFMTLNSLVEAALNQTCRPLPGCRRADVAFILDNSGSIEYKGPENWQLALNFTQNLLRSFWISEDNTRVGLIKFATEPTLVWPLNKYYSLISQLDEISKQTYQGGETEIGKAIKLALERMFTPQNGDRPDVMNIIIILTDGEDTSETVDVSEIARMARNAGIEIFVVGITDRIRIEQLRDIASDEDANHVFTVDDYDKLSTILEDVVSDTCGSSPNPIVPATPTAVAPTPVAPIARDGTCRIVSDVMFVVDTSGSIEEKSMRDVKNFIKLTIKELEIEAVGGSKFGIITFSTDADIFIPLGRYKKLNLANKRIDELTAKGGRTNMPAALKLLYERVFNGQGEDQLVAPNIAVIITDGASNTDLTAETFEEAINVKSSGIHLIVMGVGTWQVRSTLTAIASYPPEINMIEVPYFSDLIGYKDTLVKYICNSENECVSNPCRNGGSCVDGIAVYTCFCNEGYGGVNCENLCREPGDLAFTLDASGSITEINFYRLLSFLKDLVTDLPVGSGINAALQTFSNEAQVYFHLKDYQAKIQYLNVMTLPYFLNGRTNTSGALKNLRLNMFTKANGDRDNYPNIALITTDGRSNDREATWTEAMALRRTGASVIVVGLGNSVSEKELRSIVSYPTDANIFSVSSFTQLNSIRSTLVDSICNRVDECASSPCRNEGKCIDLRGGYECACPETATGINCERECSGVLDIVFIVDISGSIRRETFGDVIEEMIKIVKNLEVDKDKTRVGAISFDDNVKIQFPLGLYSSKTDVIQALRFIKYSGGRTNIAGALKLLREQMFAPDLGARTGVPRIAIAFTDGTQTVDRYNLVEEATKTKLAGIHVITVSVGQDTNLFAIEAIASEPTEANVFRARRFSQLPGVIAKVPAATCDDVNECLRTPCENSGRCVDMLGTYQCECDAGYTGRNCERVCPVQKDIAFLVDIADGRPNINSWRKTFINAFLSGLDLRSGNTRISTAVFGSRTKILYNFNQYDSNRDALIATAYSKDNSWTNTVQALSRARSTLFSSSQGDRPNVPNVLVILTDGGARDRAGAVRIARDLVSRGVDIYVAALGYHTNLAEVSPLATRADLPYVIQFNSAEAAEIAANTLLDGICQS